MNFIVDDVAAFHLACDIPILNKPQVPPYDRRVLRVRLIDEEVNRELIPAFEANDMVGIADGIVDSIYVLVGAGLEYGIPLVKVWDAVQRANMAKVDRISGKARKREDGKIIKPEGWSPPNIAEILEIAGRK